MINKEVKQKIIKKFATHKNDTGSTPVQIAILTEEINQLAEHLKIHKGDHSSRRGLLKKVSERRRLLKYLQKEDSELFLDVAKKIKLKLAKKLIEIDEAKKEKEEAERIKKGLDEDGNKIEEVEEEK